MGGIQMVYILKEECGIQMAFMHSMLLNNSCLVLIKLFVVRISASCVMSRAIIMEYLVKISKKAHILELKRRHLKITVLTSYTSYPSRKIRRICACTSLKTTKEQDSIRLDCMMVVKEIEDGLLEEMEKFGWWFEQDIGGESEDDREKKLVMVSEEGWMS
ncbi:hypothetical protein Tco_0841051 [Tanacetum coccineum]|uniref:Uncharacterized protein n=1 Tax=Tanacetum coccineum TaxID=301880 RepID=A0ABQ5AX47_9ASTR